MAPELERQLAAYHPCCEQEAVDRDVMLHFLRENTDAFTRENLVAHFTASSWIVNSSRTHALMAWHNLYRAWSWTGGHADGETDLLSVALREAREETGLVHVAPVFPEIFSLETLWVEGHEKRGKYVPCHLHLNRRRAAGKARREQRRALVHAGRSRGGLHRGMDARPRVRKAEPQGARAGLTPASL